MVTLSGASSTTAPLEDDLRAERAANRQALRACVDRAIASGELRGDTNASGLAALFDGLLLGLSTQARDGVDLEALEAAVTAALLAWDAQRPATAGS